MTAAAADVKAPGAFVPNTKYDFDLFVIGGGSGGVATGRRAAAEGVRVALAEYDRLGGTCVNVGCVPKKLYMYASLFRDEFEIAREAYGWGGVAAPALDWSVVQKKTLAEVTRLNGIYKGMLDRTKVTTFKARASLVDAHTVSVQDVEADGSDSKTPARTYTADRILIATGSAPHIPNTPGVEHAVTSNAMFQWTTLPRRIIIVGGGYIGTEFAGILNSSGNTDKGGVIQVVRGESILSYFDVDLRTSLTEEMKKRGIDIRTHTEVTRIEKRADGKLVAQLTDVKTKAVTTEVVEAVLYAAGRLPNTKRLNLEKVGVKLNAKGAVGVNEYSQTNIPSIYAVGDVTDRMMLTPVAIAEGRALVGNLYKGKNIKISYRNIPTAVFSQPELGTVGLGEEDAIKQFGVNDIDLYRAKFRPMKYSLAANSTGVAVKDEKAVLKLVVQRSTDKVLGVHMLGASAAEIIQAMGITITVGATKAQFDATIALHPSAAEEFVLMTDKVPPTTAAATAATAATATTATTATATAATATASTAATAAPAAADAKKN